MDQECLPISSWHGEWILKVHKNTKHLHYMYCIALMLVLVAPITFQRKSLLAALKPLINYMQYVLF